MPDKSAIVLDIDGCVLSDVGDVTENYFLALSKIARWSVLGNSGQFPPIVLCTGRDKNYTLAVSKMIGRPHLPCIIELGAAIYDPATNDVCLNPAITPQAMRLFAHIRKRFAPMVAKKCSALSLNKSEYVCVTFERVRPSNLAIDNLFRIIVALARKDRKLRKAIAEREVQINLTNETVSFVPKGVNKGTALRFLAGEKGICLATSLGIGDSRGDLPFLEATGLTGCPNNASATCKRLVSEKHGVSSRFNYAEAVVDIVESFELS